MAATLLPNGQQQFFDGNGTPLALGKVYFYVPNSSNFKNTWQDAAKQVLNTNPITLDAAGRATIYGEGSYRQVVRDANNNLIWDKPTASTGSDEDTQTSPGMNSFVISPQVAPEAPNSGFTVNLPAGSAQVNGIPVVIPALTVTIGANVIYDAWLNDDGSWTFAEETSSTYIYLPHFTDKLHVWRVSSDASRIAAVYLMGNANWPTTYRPNDIAGTIDDFNQLFYLYDQTTSWSSGLSVTYGQLLVTSTGNVYQVVEPGTTGVSAPTSTGSAPIVDGTAELQYYSQSSYLGMYRYAPNGGMEYYFTNIGLEQICHKTLLTGSPLGSPAGTKISTLVKKYLLGAFKHLIGERVNSGTYAFGMKVIAGGYIWLNTTVAGGTAAGSSPFSGTYTPGTSTVVDGTITWLCVYESYASQKWFWMNVDSTFLTYRSPDSHDSYASTFATLLARYLQLTDDYAWLSTASLQPSGSGTYWTYAQIFDYIINQNLDIQLANFLSKTFQYDINPSNGSAFDIQYLEDNCETVRGYRAAAYVYGVLGDTVRQAACLGNETYVGGGVASLYDSNYNLFATNYGQNVADWAEETTIGWYPFLQAQFFPELCGVTTVNNDQYKLVRFNVSLKWPNYYNDRGLDAFANNFLAWMAAVLWQDTAKAYDFVQKTERYFIRGGSSTQGTLVGAGPTTIADWGYYLATKDALVAPYTVLSVEDNEAKFLSQSGEVVSLTVPPSCVTIGPVNFDYGSTTAVRLGTTRNNGKRFIPLFITYTITAQNSATGIAASTLGVGVTAPNYNETLFTFLDASFNATGLFYNKFLPASATAVASYPSNTDVFAKMSTAISGGTMTGKISITGLEF